MQAVTDKELFKSLDSLVTNGKIKSHGVALGPAIGWKEEGLHAISEHNITSLQTVFNILEQDPGNALSIAKASLVNPKMVANPLEISRAPGTPKKNFEYLGS